MPQLHEQFLHPAQVNAVGPTSPREDVLATYYLELDATQDILRLATSFAIGQTIGTWVEVPGVTAQMRERHQGRVVNILHAPAVDLESQLEGPQHFFIQLALPSQNFEAQFPMMLTTLLGNDASTSVQAKLVDLAIPACLAKEFGGPRFGTTGVRDLLGVPDRPLLLNMVKPCTGLPPQQGAQIAYETALGGIDLIKDDELLGNPAYSPLSERVPAFLKALQAAEDETGHHTEYIPNITDRGKRLFDNARRAVDAGARFVMVTYATIGYDALQELAEVAEVPILGHFAGSGMYFEGPGSGMSADLAAGMFPRLAGADLVLTTTPYGGYPISRLSYLRTIHQLALERPHLKAAMPVIGGGVHPGVVGRYLRELGSDIVLGAGGSIQGHPGGAAAGVRAMRAAIDAALAGQHVTEAAEASSELAAALELWGVQD